MRITAVSNHIFISFSAVQIYDLSNIHLNVFFNFTLLFNVNLLGINIAWSWCVCVCVCVCEALEPREGRQKYPYHASYFLSLFWVLGNVFKHGLECSGVNPGGLGSSHTGLASKCRKFHFRGPQYRISGERIP